MTQQENAGQSRGHAGATSEGVHQRKQRVLTRRTPSVVRGIADAIVIKDEEVFFLAQPNGCVPIEGRHGYELRLAGAIPDGLAASAARGFVALFELTNPDLRLPDDSLLPKEHVGITWERTIDSDKRSLYDLITLRSYASQPIELPLSLAFGSAFEDVFAIRGLLPEYPGTLRPPQWDDGALTLAYDGADGRYRSLTLSIDPRPATVEEVTAHFRLALEPGQQTRILVAIQLTEASKPAESRPQPRGRPDVEAVQRYVAHSSRTWLDYQTEIRSDNPTLNRIMDRSLRDLRVLRESLSGREFFAAGVPWFATLFGRDSLISAIEALGYAPDIAAQTLRLLAEHQGEREDEWRDEQPGKILHERRVGELARLNEIPQGHYYGTVDATLLFLIAIGLHAQWSGDLGLFKELRGNVERALGWMASYGDPHGWGYIAYESTSDRGLINQGWKDSGDAIVNADGSLATPPIALVEVQGYAYLAKRTIAELYERVGEREAARRLRQEADDLQQRFNRDFWLDDAGFYALALQEGLRPAAVRSSNPGQALWAGIVDPARAGKTAEMLLAEDMFSGWGVRTLSSSERRYNPIGYHLGTVWPHDNALIAAGFRCYGRDDAFRKVFEGILAAASYFGQARLPELFAGFGRQEYGVPVHYPVACHPQAWAAGTVPFLVITALGLAPAALDRRLRIVRPLLPEWTNWREIRRLKVGAASVDLRFERAGDSTSVDVLHIDGELDVRVEAG